VDAAQAKPTRAQDCLLMFKEKQMQYLKSRWNSPGGYREVLAIAVPLILSTASWSVQTFVDRMFLSWYAPETIAAAMPAGMVYFSIASVFMGTAGYASTFVAQYYGAGRYHRIGPALWQGVYISFIGGIVLICAIPFAQYIFQLVGHDKPVQYNEVEYFRIICLGGGPYLASYALSGFYSGRGKTWPVMWVNIFATVVNLILDYALIFGHWGFPQMGIKGAGIATVIAGVFSFFAFLAPISIGAHNQTYHTIKGWRPEKELFMRLLRFGVPSGVQFFLEMASFTTFILLVGRLGITSLAASNIAFNINTLAFMPMIGCGIAVSMLVGQYLGADKPDLAQTSVYSGFHLTFVYMTSIAAAYVLLPDVFVTPFALKADPQGFSEIYQYSGAGDTRFVMFMTVLLSLFVLIIPTYLAIVVFKYGLMVSWVLATVYIIILGICFYLRFIGGKWKSMRVIEQAPQVPGAGSLKWGRNVK
jgi:MATE family multidrug resistance protein